MSFHIRFDGDACFDDVLLKFYSIGLRVFVIATCILHILQVVVDDGAFVIERSHGRLQSLDLDLLFGHLHGHLVLLVAQHVFVVGSGDWWACHSDTLLLLGTLRGGRCLWSTGHLRFYLMNDYLSISLNKLKLILF